PRLPRRAPARAARRAGGGVGLGRRPLRGGAGLGRARAAMTDLLYVYTVLPADSPALERLREEPPRGIDGRPVWPLAEGALAAAALEALERLSPAVRALQAEVAASAAGRAHLLRRRLAELRREELRRLDARVAAELQARLGAAADRTFAEALVEGATLARLSL